MFWLYCFLKCQYPWCSFVAHCYDVFSLRIIFGNWCCYWTNVLWSERGTNDIGAHLHLGFQSFSFITIPDSPPKLLGTCKHGEYLIVRPFPSRPSYFALPLSSLWYFQWFSFSVNFRTVSDFWHFRQEKFQRFNIWMPRCAVNFYLLVWGLQTFNDLIT